MADEVDYESDTAMAVEEEEDVRTTATKRDSGRRVVKGRGTGSAAMDAARYPAESGVFEKLKTSSSSRDHSTALRSVEGWLLFVRGVHEEAQEEDVMDAFGEDAQVKDLHLNLDRRSGFVKGYALVEFEHFEDAKAAMERMDGQEILGSTIHVDWAFQKEAERRGGGRRGAAKRR
ncbi:RNA-binding protein 8A [Phytophthora boehmeriae]|uniref:RNA-binding protein 8A n=1 Tax=Phytophthora boehmeriae TaxID=109152 RepID=A0A8T1X0R1_9STRA|nr:RNA-binding protein 8A [Phytophthora boehmeriae]